MLTGAELNADLTTVETNLLPRRFIFSEEDMNHFKSSPVKRDFLSFITVLGKSTIDSSYLYDPKNQLVGLTPGMVVLHGFLKAIANDWMIDLPPQQNVKKRFGNPMFKKWHSRLTERSLSLVACILHFHQEYPPGEISKWDSETLQICAEAGRNVALSDLADLQIISNELFKLKRNVILELQAYLHLSFGHEVRLDFGTGHECCFYIFLYSLCREGICGKVNTEVFAPVAIAITDQYLQVCRKIQTEYMLEPAGSHGVWGLDDYHCIPFYIGACQMQNKAYIFHPSDIHDDNILASTEGFVMLYFQCIRYIKSLKKGAPFSETSPMLNDISRIDIWSKIAGGLLRLLEGEVLDKRPVVQHIVFGDIFKASWETKHKEYKAPSCLFTGQTL